MSAHVYGRSQGHARNKTQFWCHFLCTLAVVHSGRKQPSNLRRDEYQNVCAQGRSCQANVYRVLNLEVRHVIVMNCLDRSKNINPETRMDQSKFGWLAWSNLDHTRTSSNIFLWISPFGSVSMIHMDHAHPSTKWMMYTIQSNTRKLLWQALDRHYGSIHRVPMDTSIWIGHDIGPTCVGCSMTL